MKGEDFLKANPGYDVSGWVLIGEFDLSRTLDTNSFLISSIETNDQSSTRAALVENKENGGIDFRTYKN